ncbi:MAG TPA: rhomboid family intramembrane serine protease [Pyrinomonadaceae bacterium]|jgi:membrane associated rhomboid family serine protease|nr:rhomboid family intramembrane serine protease [Pyrinomonadaceae bacterium]
MILPIGDDNTGRATTPLVNYVLIAANILVFILFQGMGSDDNRFTYAWATVPAEITSGRDIVTQDRDVRVEPTGQRVRVPGLQPTPVSVYLTLLVSMFMHGGWAHLGGNMLFLWIFGDNIEDRLGRLRYLLFYLICGVIASLAHVFSTVALAGGTSGMLVPSLGASGAISGVLGGYVLLYPRNRVHVIIFRIFTTVPAYVALGLWFLFQFVSGLGMLGGGAQEGGVAYAAHIGGFIAGLALVKLFAVGRPASSAPTARARWGGY